MIEEVDQALRLQETDTRIAALLAEIAQLPKHVAMIEKQLESHLRKLEADRAALAANQRERKQRDLDIQSHQQKISKLRDQMMQAKTNEQYRAFQHEIDFCEAGIRTSEDHILELMGQSEPLEIAVKAADTALSLEKVQVEAEKSSAGKRTDEDRKALAAAQSERASIMETLTPQVRAAYERLRKRYPNGHVVTDATSGTCTGCRLGLRPQFLQNLKTSAKLMFCENCGRILRYAPAVDQQALYDGGTRVSMS